MRKSCKMFRKITMVFVFECFACYTHVFIFKTKIKWLKITGHNLKVSQPLLIKFMFESFDVFVISKDELVLMGFIKTPMNIWSRHNFFQICNNKFPSDFVFVNVVRIRIRATNIDAYAKANVFLIRVNVSEGPNHYNVLDAMESYLKI